MLFVDLIFFLFFGVVLAIYWSTPSNDLRKWFLIVASYIFYGSWDWRFAIMLFCLSVMDYLFSVQILRDPARRKLYLCASLAMNLITLGFFKYFNFFIDNAIAFAQVFGVELSQPTLQIILPVGVSFFTFQSLSYTLDVYKGEIQPAKSLRDYVMFAAFFPQLVAGPIVRPKYFLPQLESARVVTFPETRAMLTLFLFGFIKKACIADNIAPYVDRVFANPAHYDALSTTTAVWLYTTQIFCDFSGYTDMAIAVAGMMGYRLVVNFNAPYLATSLQDFWRRWHISLSTWIRDYIYIPLGGNSKGRTMMYRNLVLTMLAGGLWHGSAWTFVIWGGLHGAGQVVQHEYRRLLGERLPIGKLLAWFITLQFVCVCWILFRATSFDAATTVIKQYFWLSPGGESALPVWLFFVAPALLLVQWAFARFKVVERINAIPAHSFSLAYGAAWALALALLPLGFHPFIYFQF